MLVERIQMNSASLVKDLVNINRKLASYHLGCGDAGDAGEGEDPGEGVHGQAGGEGDSPALL